MCLHFVYESETDDLPLCQMADVDKLDSYVIGNLTESEVIENKPSRDSMQVALLIVFKCRIVIVPFI